MTQRIEFVQVDESRPAFFEVVLADELDSTIYTVKDPLLAHRGMVLMPPQWDPDTGRVWRPHDILGFRNHSTPGSCAVVTLGDTQTYGISSFIEGTWPAQLETLLGAERTEKPTVYNMGMSGWGPVQYAYIASKIRLLRPKVCVVAIYTGNAFIDAMLMAYKVEHFADLRPDRAEVKLDERLTLELDFVVDDWEVYFDAFDARQVFQPGRRLRANRDDAGVRAGVLVTIEAIVTIIPTKELLYREPIRSAGIEPPREYRELLVAEERNILELEAAFRTMPGLRHAPVRTALEAAAMRGDPIFPSNNTHPNRVGYAVIARALAPSVAELLN